MIVVDSSALLAIMLDEPERPVFENTIVTRRCMISAVNAHESAAVLRLRGGGAAVERLWSFLADNEIEVVPFDKEQVLAASKAYQRYGKGIHSKARLNLCDCAAYALAKCLNAPLLFKGNDFKETDLQRC